MIESCSAQMRDRSMELRRCTLIFDSKTGESARASDRRARAIFERTAWSCPTRFRLATRRPACGAGASGRGGLSGSRPRPA